MEAAGSLPSSGLEESNISLTPGTLDAGAFKFSAVVTDDSVAEKIAKKLIDNEESLPVPILTNSLVLDHNDTTDECMQVSDKSLAKDQIAEICVGNELEKTKNLKGDIFERLIYCKAKVVRSSQKAQSGNFQAQIRKSFWLYPINQAQLSSDLKEEADILTSFFLDQQTTPKWHQTMSNNPLAFISDFFANYKPENTKNATLVLNKNIRQSEYTNAYNPQGNRYFTALIFDDFEDSRTPGAESNLSSSLELSKTLFLIESRYPFRHFFSQVLTQIFSLVRLKRLERYAINYDGNEMNIGNQALIHQYDARSILTVLFMSLRFSTKKSRLFSTLCTQAKLRMVSSLRICY